MRINVGLSVCVSLWTDVSVCMSVCVSVSMFDGSVCTCQMGYESVWVRAWSVSVLV